MGLNSEDAKERVRRANPLEQYLPARDVVLKRNGRELVACCPLHEDSTPSFSVNVEKQVFRCHGCDAGGDIFALVMAWDGLTFQQAFEQLGGHTDTAESEPRRPAPRPPKPKQEPAATVRKERGKIVATYDYTDERGVLLYQVVRFDPKDFLQRRPNGEGGWIWNLDGIGHTIYQRRRIADNPHEMVWIVEGEKDADSLNALGFVATCNSGGAGVGKWTEEHSAILTGRLCILCGDNDWDKKENKGKLHMDAVEKSVAPFARSTRRVHMPERIKDVSDFLATFQDRKQGALSLVTEAERMPELYNGMELPIRSIAEIAESYRAFIRESDSRSVKLGRWLPMLESVRPIVPGEMITILAGTGVGKTAILQNIALRIAPLTTLFFELELPETLTFERFVAIATQRSGGAVWEKFFRGTDSELGWREHGALKHIFVCDKSGLSVETMKKYATLAHLKMGGAPACVMIDYFSLINSHGGSRYERMSAAAEDIKIMSKQLNCVVICTSQVARKEKDSKSPEVFLHDAKDSGSIENSSGLVLGAWKEPGSESILHLKILKSTKGGAGKRIVCHVNESLLIEQAPTQP